MRDAPQVEFDPARFRLTRLTRRLRQRDVARELGIAPQRVSDFETGVLRPTPEQIARLREILG